MASPIIVLNWKAQLALLSTLTEFEYNELRLYWTRQWELFGNSDNLRHLNAKLPFEVEYTICPRKPDVHSHSESIYKSGTAKRASDGHRIFWLQHIDWIELTGDFS